MTLSTQQARRVLRHVAVLNRWHKFDFENPASQKLLFEEWDADFIVRRRAMTPAQLFTLLGEHRAALKRIALDAYGSEIAAAKDFLEIFRTVLAKK